MDADQVAIGGESYVALEAFGARVEGGDVRVQGVLGVVVAGAAVRDHLRAALHALHTAMMDPFARFGREVSAAIAGTCRSAGR